MIHPKEGNMNITLNMCQKVTAKKRKLFDHRKYMHEEQKGRRKTLNHIMTNYTKFIVLCLM